MDKIDQLKTNQAEVDFEKGLEIALDYMNSYISYVFLSKFYNY